MTWVQAGLLVALLLLTFIWKTVRPLRGFVLVMLVASALGSLVIPLVRSSALWTSWFETGTPSYWRSNVSELLLKLASTLIMIGLLLAMGLRRRDFFLVKGQLDAPVKRVKWLPGMKGNITWMQFGSGFAIITFLLILSLLVLLNLPRLGVNNLIAALPLLPAAALFAAMNAFHEEVVFRAAPMSQLVNVIGSQHALAITVIGFGLGHFIGGIPDSFAGVALTAFFAYIMGKAMLETRGIVWPWICHFAADLGVFIFVAIAAVAAGTA
jgi:membrane protease YdiL (CAAX protease family)